MTRQGGAWKADRLAWTIGASEGALQVSGSAKRWQGQIQAARIHASELKQGYAAWTARRGLPPNDTALPWTFSGDFPVAADTLCLHGDTDGAVGLLAAVRTALVESGVELRAFA